MVIQMNVAQLTKSGFAFEGWIPEYDIILPDFYAKYPNHWCFRVGCLDCNLHCVYCYNKRYLHTETFLLEEDKVRLVRQYGPVNTFVYTIGEPGLFIEDIRKVIEKYPSDEFRHCVKTNGTFISDRLVDDIYAINTDIKGLPNFYDQYTQYLGFYDDILKPHLKWLSEITIPEKEITYTVWLWRNDNNETKEFVLNWIDKTGARLCLNFVRSDIDFDCGYDLDLQNESVFNRICEIYEWFKQYGIEPFMCNFRFFDQVYKMKKKNP